MRNPELLPAFCLAFAVELACLRFILPAGAAATAIGPTCTVSAARLGEAARRAAETAPSRFGGGRGCGTSAPTAPAVTINARPEVSGERIEIVEG